MASHGSNFIRLRLHFDYPPPAVVDCRMCWLLVDLNASRVVADLESVIREKFDFSRGSILSLFIDDCYLPHTESIYVVRDNDSVRVKVDRLSHVNGSVSYLHETSDSGRKRQRPTEDGPEENGSSTEFKKKKRKKIREPSVENVKKLDPCNTCSTKSLEKSTEKKKEVKEKKKKKDKNPTVPGKPDGPSKKGQLPVDRTINNKKSQVSNVSSSDSSSSSDENEPPKKTAVKKSAPSTSASSKALSSSKPAQKKTAPPSSSSDSSSDEDSSVKPPPKTKPVAQTTIKPTQKKTAPPSSSSSSSSVSSSDEDKRVKPPPKTKPSAHTTPKAELSNATQTQQQEQQEQEAPPQDQTQATSSEDEIPFVIHKPVQQPSFGVRDQSSWRGRGGRGKSWRGNPERSKAGGGRATGGPNGCTEPSRNGAKEPSYQTDSLTNTSVVIQNGAENAPKKDYSSMPLLAAPPKVGQRIAFKLLELTENYTPEVSEYKEGIIVSFDAVTKQIELELHNPARAPVEPGKFDLVYQNADGTERVEYAVSRDSRVTERWASLLEPRLII